MMPPISVQFTRFAFMSLQSRTCFLFIVLISFLLLFNSCKVQRKAIYGPTYGNIDRSSPKSNKSKSRNVPVSDASGARDIDYSSNKFQNYAKLLGVSEKEVLKNAELYHMIDEWMGTPHRTGGLDRGGVDCSAFVGMVYRQVYGRDLPRSSREMADAIKRKYERQLVEGDLVFFSFGGSSIDHVGIYLHNGKFVHVSTRRGVIISDLRDTWYYRYFKRAGSPKG